MIYHRNFAVDLPEFDEMIISWNGKRPTSGEIPISVRVLLDEWSSWISYAFWGATSQRGVHHKSESSEVYQDILKISGKARGFEVQAKDLRVHVYTNGVQSPLQTALKPVELQLKGLSQMLLKHPRHLDLCSPTSTTAVLHYLLNKNAVDPVQFATNVWDEKFDIFGNWVLNTAEASTYLGDNWDVWVEKLGGFANIYERLLEKTPVIVSVRGPLQGSATPYKSGHLLVVIGFDPELREVLCMDPAFEIDAKTHVRYGLDDFLNAWNRREKIAYVFKKRRP